MNNDQETIKMLSELELMRASLSESAYKFIKSLQKARKRQKGLSTRQTDCLRDIYKNNIKS